MLEFAFLNETQRALILCKIRQCKDCFDELAYFIIMIPHTNPRLTYLFCSQGDSVLNMLPVYCRCLIKYFLLHPSQGLNATRGLSPVVHFIILTKRPTKYRERIHNNTQMCLKEVMTDPSPHS